MREENSESTKEILASFIREKKILFIRKDAPLKCTNERPFSGFAPILRGSKSDPIFTGLQWWKANAACRKGERRQPTSGARGRNRVMSINEPKPMGIP